MICQTSVPDQTDKLMWDEKSRLAAPHTGNKYKLDALAAHNVLTRKILETSHVYTYIKHMIKKNNCRIDIEAL